MPNWTANIVEIKGPVSEISKIKELLKSEYSIFDFNKILPVPKNPYGSLISEIVLRGTPLSEDEKEAIHYYKKHFDMVIKRWGTKWNAYRPVFFLAEEDDLLKYDFDTAWDAPRGVVRKLREMLHECTLKWAASHEGEDGVEYV